MKQIKTLLSENELNALLCEISQIREENRFLNPNIYSEFTRININIERLVEIRTLAERHLETDKKKKRHLRIVI